MSKLMKKTIVCFFFVLAANICSGAEPNDGSAAAIGRDDPFGGGFGASNTDQQPRTVIVDGTVRSKPAVFVRSVTLKFLSAANLKTALDKMSSEYGTVGVDDNTNSLIICDTKENLEKMLEEVKKADRTPQQIMIEVVIIDVQLKNDTEIGVDWDLLTNDRRTLNYRQSLVFPNRLSVVEPTATAIGTATAFQNVGLGTELSIITNDIRNVVNLLQEKRTVNILASPRVMVVSGQKASIKTVQEIPYQEVTQTSSGGGGSGAITSTQFKAVGVTMEVKATLTDDNKILLWVSPSQSVATGISVTGVPVVDKREATTTLLIDDGQVVVMGGLRRQEINHIKEQVPLLGDLPLIGFIFCDDRKVVDNSELLVILSPHIYKNDSLPAEAMARYNQIKSKTLITMPEEPNSQSSYGTKK
jgi:type II secretory pathway component GspD/PulD (secretin)